MNAEHVRPPDPAEEVRRDEPGEDPLRGEMGVSSERQGYAGPDHPTSTTGERVTSPPPLPEDPPPEQEPGNPEENPVGIPPKPFHGGKNPGHSHG